MSQYSDFPGLNRLEIVDRGEAELLYPEAFKGRDVSDSSETYYGVDDTHQLWRAVTLKSDPNHVILANYWDPNIGMWWYGAI